MCFEADGLNLDDRTGRSVLVKGKAVELSAPAEPRHAADVPLRFWALGEKSHWVRITPREVTGRRTHRPSGAARRPST